jgi:hypothetical protein
MKNRKRSHPIGRKKKRRQRVAEIKATIAHLKTLQGLRAKGFPVSYTSDPARLLDAAINRRGGYVGDPHSRDMAQPVRGKLPRKATGDAQASLARTARKVNSRVYLRRGELRDMKGLMDLERVADRIHEDDEGY